jgi:Subtilase family
MSKRAHQKWLALAVSFAAAHASQAGAADAASIVKGREGVLNLRTGDVTFDSLPNLLGQAGFSTRWVVLRLDGPMTPDREIALSNAGATLAGYLPTNAFIADVRGSTPAALAATGFVIGAYAYQDAWRIDPVIRGANAQVHANLWLFEGADAAGTQAAIAARGAVRLEEVEAVGAGWRLSVSGPAADVRAVAIFDDVQYVEPLPAYELRNNATTRWTIQSGVLDSTPLYGRGLTGLGQVIGVIDGGLAVSHCSFLDSVNPIGPLHRKIKAYNTTQAYDQHGTHVACTAAGDAGNTGNTRGIAYDARIVFNTYPSATETSVFTKHKTHYDQGAYVNTNSWGTDFTRAYDGGSRAIDVFLHDNDDALVTHAASNGGVVTNPENAKNSLCVTASRNGTDMDLICVGGAGPTLDGRRKPEVAAPGCQIVSATGSTGCGILSLSGTSMATPAVGGLAVLVRQYYASGYYPAGSASAFSAFTPSGSLVKATIVNGAQDMVSLPGYPSDREGWGRVLADASLYFSGDARTLVVRDVRNASSSALTTGGFYEFQVLVSPSSESLRVTMCYADSPAQVNAALTPVNNLNLSVTSPDGALYLGNVFSGGFSTTGGAADSLNNLEQVHLATPTPGVWTVRVDAASVNVGPQGFALVVTGAVSEAPICHADFNQDGGVDGQDVEAFFLTWATGDESADFNQDGGVDGQDVEAFFIAWGAGC